jgi:hypothetical protein
LPEDVDSIMLSQGAMSIDELKEVAAFNILKNQVAGARQQET